MDPERWPDADPDFIYEDPEQWFPEDDSLTVSEAIQRLLDAYKFQARVYVHVARQVGKAFIVGGIDVSAPESDGPPVYRKGRRMPPPATNRTYGPRKDPFAKRGQARR